jgi:rhodanese-related sulfurtransferase
MPKGANWLNEMPSVVDRGQVKRLVESGAQLVEVLPADEYEEDHIPGAMSLPLRRLEAEAVSRLDHNRPVIVYCWDAA